MFHCPGQVDLSSRPGAKAIEVWWQYIIIVIVLILGGYCFLVLTGFETRMLSRKTKRTAESMYSNYADSNREQRRYAKNRHGQWQDDGNRTP